MANHYRRPFLQKDIGKLFVAAESFFHVSHISGVRYSTSGITGDINMGGINMSNISEEKNLVRVFCKFITKNGKRIYPKNGTCFSFLVNAAL